MKLHDVQKELHDLWCVVSGKCNIFGREDAKKLFSDDSDTSAIYHWLRDQEDAANQSTENINIIEEAHMPPHSRGL